MSYLSKRLAPVATLLSVVVAATAQPPVVPTPAGLNPAIPVNTYANPNSGHAVTVGEELFASGGDVTVTFLGPTGAGYDEHLFVASPANAFGQFFDDHTTANGLTYDLGTYAAGTEIEFGLFVDSTGNTWYDGPASRNTDGVVHAYTVNDFEGLPSTTYVGFEDETARIADYNYVDEIYAFTGVAASVNPPMVPDSAATLSLLGMGLTTLAWCGRRFRK